MWALLKPLVGLDPKTANLFEQPLLKGRLQALLGDNYDTAVSLLNTADKIQQEGPLFYLVSNYTPVPQLAEKAGFVWNAETNQMAVLLVSGGAPLVFAEQLNQQAAKVIPSWPAQLVDYTDPVKLKKMAVNKAAATAGTSLGLSEQQTALATTAATGGDVKQLAVTQATNAATQTATDSLGLSENQAALAKAAATGGDVKQLALTQASEAATQTATDTLGLSEQQAALAKTAATGGDVKQLAVTQATKAATEAATASATSELGLSTQQAEFAQQAVTGANTEQLTAQFEQQTAGQQVKQQLAEKQQQVVAQATDPIRTPINTQQDKLNPLAAAETKVADSNQLPPVLVPSQLSIEDLKTQLKTATEQEMAAEMALEQADAKIATAEALLTQASTGSVQASSVQESANTAIAQAQAEQKAASSTLLQAQQKVQALTQQLTLRLPTTVKPVEKPAVQPTEN